MPKPEDADVSGGDSSEPQVAKVGLQTGSFAFVDGSKYEGEYREEGGRRVRHGQGTYTNGDETYVGQWKDDKMSGAGKYVFASKAVYEGEFDEDKFHGHGRYTWPNNEREYVGEFADNKFHGKGQYTDAKKVVWEGVFHNGKFLSRKTWVLLS